MTSTNPTCNQTNGTATATPSGGTPGFTYSWAPGGQTTQTATGLGVGTYTVVVTDAANCSNTLNVTLTSSAPTVTASGTGTNCFAGTTGSANSNVSGGSPGYTYLWLPGNFTTANISNLGSNTYTLTVTDQNNCTSSDTVLITQPTAIQPGGSTTPGTCGSNTGTATVTVSGGTPGYTFSWNNGQTAATATVLATGIYSVIITDSKGCTAQAVFNVTSSGNNITSTDVPTHVLCFGGNNGSATVTPSGGTSPYSYSWYNGQNTATATGLTSGTYVVQITDNSGCTLLDTVTITQPTQITASTTTTQSSCASPTGTATVTANGGTTGYTYSWNNGQTTATASGLAAGNYTVVVTDNNGCTTQATANITAGGGNIAPNATTQNVSCFGGGDGSATLNPSGGTAPYSYSWYNGQNTATATGLIAGTYSVLITDASGCTSTGSVSVSQPNALQAATTATNDLCNQGSGTANANANGGTPNYSYSWNNGQTSANASGLIAGSYTVIVTDSKGCTTSSSVNVNNTSSSLLNAGGDLTITQGQTASLNASGGGTYTWTPATGLSCTICQNPIATPNATTTYIVSGTDANGCIDSDTVIITVEIPCIIASLDKLLPNAFSPNSDGKNDLYCVPKNVCIQSFTLKIFDRWGEKVFESNSFDNCWDGTQLNKNVNTAVFTYTFYATLTDGSNLSLNGLINLIR
jgi:gliding motility-associated-like protein